MPKVGPPQLAGPDTGHKADDGASRRSVRPRDVPYSVAWFRDRFASYALGTIVCGSAMLLLAMWMGGSLGAFGQKMNNGFNVIAGWAGVAVQEVDVCAKPSENMKTTACPELDAATRAKVVAAAGVAPGVSIISADPYAIRDRVEKLDVGAASVKRMWPNRVKIEVEQREAIALWQERASDGPWRVVDQSGRAFVDPDMSRYGGLPRVVGRNAAAAAAPFMAAIRDFPGLAKRLQVAYRVDGRRWDVKFAGRTGLVILPEDPQLHRALECLNLQHAENGLLDLPAGRIDARRDCMLAIQPLPAAPVADPGRT